MIRKFFPLIIVCISLNLTSPLNADPAPEPIKIGAIFSLTSYGAMWGTAEKQATDLAIEDVNAAGGVNGRQLQLLVEDNNSDLKKSVAAFKKLAGLERVTAVLGPNWAEFTEVVVPLANQAQLVTLTASGFKESIFKDGSFVFSAWPAHDFTLDRYAQYLASRGHKKLALLTANNTYYQEISDALERQLKLDGFSPSLKSSFNPDELDFRTTILNLKKNGYDAVILALMLNGSLSAFLQQARDMNYQAAFYADNDFTLDSILQAHPEIGDGVTFFNWTADPNSPFTKRYQERYKTMPVVSSAAAYDNVFVLKKALELSAAQPEKKLREAVLQVRHDGYSGEVAFTDNGRIKSPHVQAKIFRSDGGKFVEVD